MTAFDYSRLRGTANRLITRFGQTATLSRLQPATEPQTPWEVQPGGTTNAAVSQTFDVTVIEDGSKVHYSRDDGGALIPRTVRVLTVSAAGEAPRMGDRITLAGATHEIARVDPLQPGGVALLYEVELAQ